MPLGMQTRLLRVLQERQVTPLGGGHAVDVDFALICATHCNLRQAVDSGHFRTDLYYRINGLTLLLPSLRDRTDLQALTERLLDELAPGRRLTVSADLLRRFATHSWPGNLRQYASLLRTAVAMLDDDENVIDWPHLPDDFAEELVATPSASALPAVSVEGGSLAEVSRSAIQRALEASRGNVSAAARLLGVSRQTLYRKLRARAAKE
jgi:sigma-54 dependent transcriptional regulator, acetoin dehydrogenase operon transcriptional activator AcoR